MKTQKKPIYKTVIFWELLIGTIIVFALVIGIAVGMEAPASLELPETQPQTQPSEETIPVETTEETLPPPPENPYGPLDFKYEGEYLTCLAGESSLGVDVSTWQGNIDWQQVKDAGVEYAIIRIGYRGTEGGILGLDDYAQINYEGATAAGIKTGVYFFSQAITVEEALEEAEFVLDAIRDWDLQMPVVYDWEYVDEDARTAGMDARTLTDCTKAFCQMVEDAGYDSMIYFNANQSRKKMYLEELIDYGFWLAMYDPVMTYAYKIDMWQYTNEGSVPGIDGNVDLNLYFTY